MFFFVVLFILWWFCFEGSLPSKAQQVFSGTNVTFFCSTFSALVSALCCKGGYSGTLIVLEEEDNGMETKGSVEAVYGQCSGISCSFQIIVDMWVMDKGSLSRLGRDLLISFIGANFTATNLLKFIPVFKLHSVKKVKLNAIFLEYFVLQEVEQVPHAF